MVDLLHIKDRNTRSTRKTLMAAYKRKLLSSLLSSFTSLIPPKVGTVVLTLHNIPSHHYEWFENFISYLNENYQIINPFEFDWNKKINKNSPQVILTFDDGFYSNRKLAEKVLSRYKIKGIFFITEDFIDSKRPIAFIQERFYPNTKPVIQNEDDFAPMSWNDVNWLIGDGHMIGAHTKTHPLLSSITNQEKLYDEMITSSDRMEKLINTDISCFAIPFGTVESVNKDILKAARNRYDVIFSNIRGNIHESPSRSFIFRQNIVPGDPLTLIDIMISGHLDWRYRKVRNEAISKFSF